MVSGMNAKTFRIILGVLCIAAFMAAMFTPVISFKGSPALSLCDLISSNKTLNASGFLSGFSAWQGAVLDGVMILAILGFIAAMTALLASYLALINTVPKIFPGISGLVAAAASIGYAVCAIAVKNRVNGFSPLMELSSMGWGAIALIVLAAGMLGISVLLLILRERKAASGKAGTRSAAAPASREPAADHPAPAAFSPAYPTYTRRGTAPSQYGSGYTAYGTQLSGYAGSAAYRQQTAVIPEWGTPGSAPRKPVYVMGLEGTYKDARFDISDGSPVTFGRDAGSCQIVYDKFETLISRRHCSIRYNADYDMFEACDMSRNGTFIDGLSKKLPADETQFLPHGTVIFIGSAKEAFRLE